MSNMADTDKKPKIRFKGFTDDWESRELGTIAKFNPKEELPETFEYVDLESVVGTELIAHRKETKATAPSRAQRLARQGDLFYQTVRPYQKNNYLFEKSSNNYVFSTGYAQMRPYGDGYFLLSLVQNNEFVKAVIDRCTGTSYPAINSSNLAEIKVFVPEKIDEQTKIGILFKQLYTLLTLHQRRYDKLANVKKSMLENMFPKNGANVPEIRFKGFAGAWEESEYSETFNSIPNNTFSRAKLNYNSGLAKNIHYGDVLIKFGELLNVEKDEIPYITDDTIVNKLKSSKLQNGDVIIADAAEDETVGKCTELINVGKEIVLSGLHTIPIRPSLYFASGYLGYFMNSPAYHNQLLRLMQGTKVTSISKTALQDTVIFSPTDITEQCKISELFQTLDHLITFHQQELEKLKNIKKAFLEKMFI